MPVSLADLPAFRVASIDDVSPDPLLIGEFTHLTSVREGRSWLYAGNEFSLIGDVVELNPQTRHATFVAPFWSRGSPIQVGSLVPWVGGYWQAYHVTMIIDPSAAWRRVEFAASAAQHFFLGDAHGWGKVGVDLPEGARATHIEPGGWDHEHCELCDKHIGKNGESLGYVDMEEHWLCRQLPSTICPAA
jgi:hypothetical protein